MPKAEQNPRIGVEAVLELSGTNREAKAYAFLYAAFKRTEISSNPVRDALDCLTPFIAPYLNTVAGKQISVEGIQDYLKSSFGFDIPIYAIEQLIPALQKAGYVEFNRATRAHISKRHESQFDLVKSEIETEFDEVVSGLSEYAKEMGFTAEPPSGSWGEALIAFLKTQTDRTTPKVVNVKGVIVQPVKAENAIVAAFITRLHERAPATFDKLVNIFMGVLVEEFISSMSEIGGMDLEHPVHVLFDTAVLLRLLGCSGKLLKTATDELTRYLQDLGFRIYYFSGNEAEVAGILDTIIHKKDTGQELEGETAEAISAGEVSMGELRMLQNTLPERLAVLHVFSADMLENSALDNAKYQIDEGGFSEYLKRKALANGRVYGAKNADNDSRYLGSIVRLRRRMNTRDLAGCGYVFVTSNKFLAQASRRYLIEQGVTQPQHCPPILSVGQMATIAWLMKDKTLEPEKAGRELLSNCFAAVRPDQEWFRYFREGIERVKGNIEEYGKEPSNALILQAARRIAQEESFGESALVRALNMVEILNRAEQESQRVLAEKDVAVAAEREAALLEFGRQRAQAVDDARTVEQQRQRDARTERANALAGRVIGLLKGSAVVLFLVASVAAAYYQWRGQPSAIAWALTVVLIIVNVFAFMDMIGVSVAKRFFDRLRVTIANSIARALTA